MSDAWIGYIPVAIACVVTLTVFCFAFWAAAKTKILVSLFEEGSIEYVSFGSVYLGPKDGRDRYFYIGGSGDGGTSFTYAVLGRLGRPSFVGDPTMPKEVREFFGTIPRFALVAITNAAIGHVVRKAPQSVAVQENDRSTVYLILVASRRKAGSHTRGHDKKKLEWPKRNSPAT